MTAANTQFPLSVSRWGANPRFKTDIIQGRNGQEVRNRIWQDPLRVYNAAFAVKTYQDVQTLHTFFLACGGRELSFLVKDPLDYKVDTWTVFGETVDGSRTTFQLIKKYTQSVLGTYTRNITKPKQLEGVGGVQIRDNGVTVSTSNYSFSESTGIVTFSSPPTSGHTVDFKCDEFYVPVRFESDELPVDLLYWYVQSSTDDGRIEIPEIRLVEVRDE